MPARKPNETKEPPAVRSTASFGFSAIDQECVTHLVGHTIALVECELILQTLRYNQGNRTRTADLLGISVRSLRDKIRHYRDQGHSVPEPRSQSDEEISVTKYRENLVELLTQATPNAHDLRLFRIDRRV
jgi:DNA-binding protein Fis